MKTSVFKSIRKYIKIQWLLLKANFEVFLQYRNNALVGSLGALFYNIGAVLFINILFSRVDSVAGWDRWDLIFLYAIGQILAYLYYFATFQNIHNFSSLINSGDFDFLLLKPYNSIIYSTLRKFSMESILHMIIPFGFIYYILQHKVYNITLLSVFLFLFSLVASYIMIHLINVVLVVPTMKIVKNQFERVYRKTAEISQYPYELFSRPVEKVIFLFAFPLGLLNNIPFRILVGKAQLWEILIQVASTIFLLFIVKLFWGLGLKVYSSASS